MSTGTERPSVASAGRGRLDGSQKALYARLGARILWVAVTGALLLCFVSGTASIFAIGHYLRLDTGALIHFQLIFTPLILLCELAGLIPAAGQVRTILAWSGPGRTAQAAPAAWRAVVGIRRPVTTCAVSAVPAFLLAFVYMTAHFHQPWWVMPLLLAWGTLLVVSAWFVIVSASGLLVHPMLIDIVGYLPALEPEDRPPRVRRRALAPLPIITAYGMLLVGSYTDLTRAGPQRLSIALGASLIMMAVAVPVFAIFARLVLDPIGRLIEATERVAAGDLQTSVPVLSDDQLGALTFGFNEMLVGLREREALDLALGRSRMRFAAAADLARRGVERELRDRVLSRLDAARELLSAAVATPDPGPQATTGTLDAAAAELRRSLQELREVAHGVFPALLVNDGLSAAINDEARRLGVSLEWHGSESGELEPAIEVAAYLCARETLGNIARYACPGVGARVGITRRDRSLRLVIGADVAGVAGVAGGAETLPAAWPAGGDLQTISDRIEALGGELTLSTHEAAGTTVRATLPLPSPSEAAASPDQTALVTDAAVPDSCRRLIIGLTGGILLGVLVGLLAALSLAEYLGLPAAHYVYLMTIWAPITFVALLAGLAPSSSGLGTILAFSPAHPRPTSAETWRALVELPQSLAIACAGAAVALFASLVDVVIVYHEPAWALVPFEASGLILVLAIYVVLTATTQLVMRPVLRGVARSLPSDFRPAARAISFRFKALAPLPIVAVCGIFAVGAFTGVAAAGPDRLALSLAITLAAIVVAGGVFASAIAVVFDPVDELAEAMRRVRTGDLDADLPVIGTDELTGLARGFNAMLAGLRERQRLRHELRASSARIVAAADAERRRVERDIHDGAQQQLVVLGLKLSVARRALERDPAMARTMLNELHDELEAAQAELQALARGIYPEELEDGGLSVALYHAADRAALPTSVECRGVGRHARELEAAVYFCCLEALQNAGKHAGRGARASVQLARRGDRLEFSVADDGRGFRVSRDRRHAGLQNMADRIGTLGGTLAIESAPGAGTVVSGTIPLKGDVRCA